MKTTKPLFAALQIRPARIAACVHVALVLGAAGLCTAATAAGLGDPFATDELLHERAERLTDPLGRPCPTPAGSLSLGTAVDVALCRNPGTRAAWAQARVQAANVGAAESAWVPSITGTASGTRQTGGTHVDPQGEYVSFSQNTGDAAAQLTWTLYDFGARTGRIASARRLLDAAALTTDSTVQQTVLAVVQAFYGVIAAEDNLVALQKDEARYDQILEVARGLRSGGVASLADVLQVETAREQAELLRVQAEGAVKTTRGTLAVTLGLRADEQYPLQGDTVPEQLPALTSRVAELIDAAAAQRPDLAAARAQRDSAQSDLQVAKAAGWPTISLAGGRDYIEGTNLPRQSYNTFGISLSWPIFTGYNVTYGIRHAKAALEASEINVEQVRLNVTRDVWNGYYSLDSANRQVTSTKALLQTAEQNEDVALGRYKSGVATIIDLLTAEAGLVSANQARILADLNWQVARAQLVLALGVLRNADPLKNAALP